MDLADGFDELDRQAQGARRLHRAAQQLSQRNAAGILQHQQGAPALAHQLQGPGGPGGVEVFLQRVFVEEAVDRGGRRRIEGRRHRQHALLPLTLSPAAIEDKVAVLLHAFQLRQRWDRGLPFDGGRSSKPGRHTRPGRHTHNPKTEAA